MPTVDFRPFPSSIVIISCARLNPRAQTQMTPRPANPGERKRKKKINAVATLPEATTGVSQRKRKNGMVKNELSKHPVTTSAPNQLRAATRLNPQVSPRRAAGPAAAAAASPDQAVPTQPR